VRRRILFAIVGVATVAVLLFAIPLAVTIRDLTIQDELNELERTGQRVERSIEPEHLATTARHALNRRGHGFTLGVYDDSGLKVAGRGPVHLEADLRGALSGAVPRQEGSPLRVALPIGMPPTSGVVRVTSQSATVNDRVVRAWLLVGAFALAAIAAAGALAWWLSRRLDAPLSRLAVAARRIGDGDFTSRVPRSGVAEIDDVAEAMDTTAARLGNALERERAFSSDVSHQLRTRIAALRVTLESASITHVPHHETIENALTETDRLEATIDELIALARDTHAVRAPLDARTLLDDVERRWHSRLAASGRPLRLVVDPDLPRPRSSASAARQILEVLVDNAARHGRGEIRISARSAVDGLAIDVTDDGPGVDGDPEDLFGRRAATNNGHGIGLALARTLADAEGGRLVLTRRHPGATFTLLLPGPVDRN
jgi:signal transduction histidine kinase